MRNWLFSLQFRLAVSFALVLALVLGSVSAYIGLAAHREAEHLQARTDRARSFRIQEILARFYSVNGDWDNLQPVLERTSFALGHAIILLDGDGMPVARTAGVTFDSDEMHRADFTPVMVDGEQVGSVYIEPDSRHSDRDRFGRRGSSRPSGLAGVRGGPFPVETGAFEEPLWSRFAEVTNRSLLWAGRRRRGRRSSAGVPDVQTDAEVRPHAYLSRQADGRWRLSQRVPAEGRDEIGELARTFNAMADGLESAERQRRNMVADAAHELRTPLSNIRGYVEAVRDGVLKPDPETLGTIHQQVLYLTDLVDDLRLLAETEAGDFGLNRQPGSLFEAVRTSVEGVRARAEAKGVVLEVDLPAGSPGVEFDRTRISQVVGNLLDNAIRHTPPGGTVTVSAGVGPAAATVSVTDTGEGMPTEAIPFVFERFYRVDPSRSRSTGGAGLGLTIAKQLVEAHGGSIRVHSTAGEGTTITFDLPLGG